MMMIVVNCCCLASGYSEKLDGRRALVPGGAAAGLAS